MDILREKVTGISELTNVLSENGFEIVSQSQNMYFTIKYTKCDTGLTCDLINSPSPEHPGYISIVNLYNDGICLHYGVTQLDYNHTYAFIAPEADEDTWILLRVENDLYGRAQIKIDENEGWRYIYNHETYPTLNSIQLVNYYDIKTQKIFGNLYICKKLPAYRLVNRYYWPELETVSPEDPLFPNVDRDKLEYSQHISCLKSGERHKSLFGERIRIDDKIFVVHHAFSWNYGTNRTENVRTDCPAPIAFRVT